MFSLANGDLYLSSLRDYLSGQFDNAKFAILGGTGDYRTARGDGTGTVSDPVAHSYKFVLNLTTG